MDRNYIPNAHNSL
jgi:hypothetical protein